MIQIPLDNYLMTKRFKKDRGGCCGLASLAAIGHKTIAEVLSEWERAGIEFKGYAGYRQLQQYLRINGYVVKVIKRPLLFFDGYSYIARIQWLGEEGKREAPFYGWGHWSVASAWTHFVLIKDGEVFCNETGIFPFKDFPQYLKDGDGVVTSYLEIHKEA